MSRRSAWIAAMLLFVLSIACGCSSVSGDSAGEAPSSGGDPLEAEVQARLSAMTAEQKVAALFVVGPDTLQGLVPDGSDPLESYPVSGFIYFGEHLQDPAQTRAMLADAQERMRDVTGLPAFLCVDEEGGTVVRVAGNGAFGVDDVGDMSAIGATGDAEKARAAALYIGGYLADLGFNVDFAPVCDLAEGGDDVMSDRSFGADPELTAQMVAAQVQGFSGAGILCSAKHFPGIGGVAGDSHDGTITSRRSLDEFRATSLVPFARAIEAGVPFVMVGHISTPAVTGDDAPATVSPEWVTGVLRDEMGFDGVVVTDSLLMGAMAGRYSQYDIGVLALEAGADILLHPADFEAAYRGVLDAVRSGRISEERLDESVARILRLKLSRL